MHNKYSKYDTGMQIQIQQPTNTKTIDFKQIVI